MLQLAYALLVLVSAPGLFYLVMRRRHLARAVAELEAARRAEFAPVEARAALTQWILHQQSAFTVQGAVLATEMLGRVMTEGEVEAVCSSLSLSVPSLRAILPFHTLKDMPKQPAATSVRKNGATVTYLNANRPPETWGMSRGQYDAWLREQNRKKLQDQADGGGKAS
jgi:hypothetical protein